MLFGAEFGPRGAGGGDGRQIGGAFLPQADPRVLRLSVLDTLRQAQLDAAHHAH